jgi:hypothetical protein
MQGEIVYWTWSSVVVVVVVAAAAAVVVGGHERSIYWGGLIGSVWRGPKKGWFWMVKVWGKSLFLREGGLFHSFVVCSMASMT